MDRQAPRTLLEQLKRLSNQTWKEVTADFLATAKRMRVTNLSLTDRQIQRWASGESRYAHPAARKVAEQHWGYPFDVLIGPPRGDLEKLQSGTDLNVATAFPFEALEVAALMAANESSQYAASLGDGVSPLSIEQRQATVHNLAKHYHEISPIHLLGRARMNRDLSYRLLDKTKRPMQVRDCLVNLSHSCGLMALASFDLGIWDAAEEQARAARTFADSSEIPGLQAWTAGTHALIAFWNGQPRRSLEITQAGISSGPSGKQLARLKGIEARAHALLGDVSSVENAVQAADQAMTSARGHDEMMDGIGGEFGWGPSLHAACAGTAFLVVGDGDQAATWIQKALDALPEDEHASLVPQRAQIDLAGAQLLAGRLDDAEAALASIWDIPVAFRRQTYTGRLDLVAKILVNQQWRTDSAAQTLRDRIEGFNAEAVSQRALPGA